MFGFPAGELRGKQSLEGCKPNRGVAKRAEEGGQDLRIQLVACVGLHAEVWAPDGRTVDRSVDPGLPVPWADPLVLDLVEGQDLPADLGTSGNAPQDGDWSLSEESV